MIIDEAITPQKRFCPDCGAECQLVASGWRCPWATSARQGTAWVGGELVLCCRAPYERTREVLVPQQTRTR